MHPPGNSSIKALLLGLAAACVILVSLAQFELISRGAKKLNHKVEKALHRLDLDEPVGNFFSFQGNKAGAGNMQGHHVGIHASHDAHKAATDGLTGGEEPPKKVGAGMLFIAPGPQVLLLKRRSKHNDSTWGLPGGNRDAEDNGNLMATARREAIEEMGSLPAEYTIKGSILTKRGKFKRKHYTVFLAEVPASVQRSYTPQLDPMEHSEWHWFSLTRLLQLQPAQQEGEQGGGMSGLSTTTIASAGEVELHPVVALLVGPDHRQELTSLLPVNA